MQSALTDTNGSLTRTEHLAEAIRLDIVRNHFKPGERLTEEAIAARYELSRTPVREALKMLARESLLVHTPRTGYAVALLNIDEMDDLYAVRVAIEEQVAERLSRVSVEMPLRDLLLFWERVPEPAKPDVNLVYADERFHETLAEACGSGVLAPMLRNINQRVHALRIRDFVDGGRVRLTYQQHTAILHALIERDTRLARSLLRSHIWQSYAFVRSSTPTSEVTK